MASTWIPRGYGPVRLVNDAMSFAPRVATLLRDFVSRRRAELKEERLSLSQDERAEAHNEKIAQLFEDQAVDRRRRRVDAFRVILEHNRKQDRAEAEAVVSSIRKNIVTNLQLEGWAAKDIRTLLENRLLRIEKAIQELLFYHIEGKLEERNTIISLLDLDLDDMERQPGLV